MANAWLRLWHDMPNDPKWRTIARVSGQPIATVMAVYIHLLVSASRNVTRGHIDVTTEDLASALDVTEEVIDSIWMGKTPGAERGQRQYFANRKISGRAQEGAAREGKKAGTKWRLSRRVTKCHAHVTTSHDR